jgi:hypothetical protein
MLELNTCKNAESAAQTLQLYFRSPPVRELSSGIPSEFVPRALELVLYLLPYMKPERESYVREKLYVSTGSISEGVREAMTRQVPAEARSDFLEHDLRVVVALLRDAQTLTPPQLEHVGTLLEPLWEHRAANPPIPENDARR